MIIDFSRWHCLSRHLETFTYSSCTLKVYSAHLASRNFVLQPFRTQAICTLGVSNPDPNSDLTLTQWRRQLSKGAMSFRGQKILQPCRSPGCTFFLKKVDDLFYLSLSKHRPPTPFHRQSKTNKAVRCSNIFYFLFTLLPKQSNTQG